MDQAANEAEQAVNALNSMLPELEKLGFNILISVIIFVVGRKIIRIVLKTVDDFSRKANTDETLHQFLKSFVEVALYILLVFMIAVQLGFNTASIVTLLGSAALAIGLSLQGSLSNLAGGVVILVTRPFANGDYIVSSAAEGTVKEIGIIYTKIETVDKKIITVPNGTLSAASITNCTSSPLRRVDINVPVSYTADLKKAKEVVVSVYNANPDIVKDGSVSAHVSELGDSAVVIGACGFVESGKYWPVRWQLIEDIKLALDEADIEIPFNQLDVNIRK